MWKQESPFVNALIEHFEKHEISSVVGFNEPYSGKTIRAHTVEYYADVYQLPTVIFEVRQDLLGDAYAIERWSNIIKLAIFDALSALES
jgi:N-formylglutamate deformylase